MGQSPRRKNKLHSFNFFTRFNSSLGAALKSIRSTLCPYLLRSITGGDGVLGLDGVKSLNVVLALAAIVDAHVAGVVLLLPEVAEAAEVVAAVPLEFEGVLLTARGLGCPIFDDEYEFAVVTAFSQV